MDAGRVVRQEGAAIAKVFFDTNVVVYALDPDSPEKSRIARQLIREHLSDSSGVLSSQVLLEMFRVCVRKFKVAPQDAKSYAKDLMNLQVVIPQIENVLEAMDLVTLSQISIWDGLILSSALSAKCSTVYSEDMQDGFKVRGLTIVNPFKNLA